MGRGSEVVWVCLMPEQAGCVHPLSGWGGILLRFRLFNALMDHGSGIWKDVIGGSASVIGLVCQSQPVHNKPHVCVRGTTRLGRFSAL